MTATERIENKEKRKSQHNTKNFTINNKNSWWIGRLWAVCVHPNVCGSEFMCQKVTENIRERNDSVLKG